MAAGVIFVVSLYDNHGLALWRRGFEAPCKLGESAAVCPFELLGQLHADGCLAVAKHLKRLRQELPDTEWRFVEYERVTAFGVLLEKCAPVTWLAGRKALEYVAGWRKTR